MRISDWSSDVCSSDLAVARRLADASAQVEADRRDEKAEQEGNTPAPINHLLFGEECLEQERSAERREHRDARAQLLEGRSAEHTFELQSLMRIAYNIFCNKNKTILKVYHDSTKN